MFDGWWYFYQRSVSVVFHRKIHRFTNHATIVYIGFLHTQISRLLQGGPSLGEITHPIQPKWKHDYRVLTRHPLTESDTWCNRSMLLPHSSRVKDTPSGQSMTSLTQKITVMDTVHIMSVDESILIYHHLCFNITVPRGDACWSGCNLFQDR